MISNNIYQTLFNIYNHMYNLNTVMTSSDNFIRYFTLRNIE